MSHSVLLCIIWLWEQTLCSFLCSFGAFAHPVSDVAHTPSRVYRDRTEPGTRQAHLNTERSDECTVAFVYCVEGKKQRHAGPSLFTAVHRLESKHLSGREEGLAALAGGERSLTSQKRSFPGNRAQSSKPGHLTLMPDLRQVHPSAHPCGPLNGSARRHLDRGRLDHCARGRGSPRRGGGIPRSGWTGGAHWPRVRMAAAD